MIIVLDTNVLISGIFWQGTPSHIIEKWHAEKFDVAISQLILEEYVEVYERITKKYLQLDIPRLIDEIIKKAVFIKPKKNLCYPSSRDIKDNIFIECALTIGADYLVTGDKDLQVLKDEIDINIVTPATFHKAL